MLACVDVQYGESGGQVAFVVFQEWQSESPVAEYIHHIDQVAEYVPGEFYRREMPCILESLKLIREELSLLIVDGYVWLDRQQKPGLGGHLFHALDEGLPVVGVAKAAFKGSEHAIPVCRGDSKKPLYVTAAGFSPQQAADNIVHMHGKFRIPTLLKRVDTLCRQKGKQSESKTL